MWWWLITIACLIHASGISEELIRRLRDINPELGLNVSQMISYEGYPGEEHQVLTNDGYYLTINRIPGGKNNPDFRDLKPVVLLQHGLLEDASNWIINMPRNSLGFILADAGYDVWLGNNRGRRGSDRHQYLSTDQEEFWDFSFHEMAMYDLPAIINFILTKTGQKELYYICHSQGCTIGFIAFSAIPELSHKIRMFFTFGPDISFTHSPSPLVKLLLSVPKSIIKLVLGKKRFAILPRPAQTLFSHLCGHFVMQRLCAYLLFFYGGFNATQVNLTRADVYADHFPETTSVKNLLHWKQVKGSGLFRYYDYGSENQARYNQSYPPSYHIEEMVVPTAVWSGGKDLVADPEDMKHFLPRIANLVYHHHLTDWTHVTFVFGINGARLLYIEIAELVQKCLEMISFPTVDLN